MSGAPASGGGGTQMSPAQQNLMARNLILYGGGGFPPAQDIWQEITGFATPSSPAPGSQYSIYLRPVGLVKRIMVEFSMTVTANAASALTLTKPGLSNLLNPILLYDLSNYTRINTSSLHLAVASTARRRRAWIASQVAMNPWGMGDNVPAIAQAVVNIAASGAATISGFFEVPVSVNDDDLRGAVYASVTQATMLLQFTINPSFFNTGADNTQSVYDAGSGGTAGSLSNVTFRIYQNYLDKLPMMQTKGGGAVPILPADDISRALLLNSSSWTSLSANTDTSIPFVNSREFQSVVAMYDNAGVLNPGTDINYLAVNSANLTPLDKVDPILHSARTRVMFGLDLPQGMYYWDFRRRPIDTNQAGNTQLVVNLSSVGSSPAPVLYLWWESVAQLGLVNAAGAIPSGG